MGHFLYNEPIYTYMINTYILIHYTHIEDICQLHTYVDRHYVDRYNPSNSVRMGPPAGILITIVKV